MRILYVTPPLAIAGGIRIVIEHCNRLAEHHEVAIATLDGSRRCDWLSVNVPIMNILQAEAEEWDVAVATEASTWERVAHEYEGAKRKFGFCQMREHLFYPEIHKETIENLFTLLQPITISHWLADWLHSLGHEYVPIIPNGVNFDMFYPEPFETSFLRYDKPIVLIEGYEQGNLAKNTHDAHKVFDILQDRGYDIYKWGFSQDEQEGNRWNWDQFWASPSQDTIRRIYSTAGASGGFLLKTSKYEGRNCTVVEAMSCGCPVVVTECGGVDDLHHGYNCLLSPYGDIDVLVEHSCTLLDHEGFRGARITDGIEYVRKELHWGEIIPKLERILEGERNEHSNCLPS